MQNLLIILIVALAGIYVMQRFWKSSKEDADCACGCSSCNMDKTCDESAKKDC